MDNPYYDWHQPSFHNNRSFKLMGSPNDLNNSVCNLYVRRAPLLSASDHTPAISHTHTHTHTHTQTAEVEGFCLYKIDAPSRCLCEEIG